MRIFEISSNNKNPEKVFLGVLWVKMKFAKDNVKGKRARLTNHQAVLANKVSLINIQTIEWAFYGVS